MKIDFFFPDNILAVFSEKSDGSCSVGEPIASSPFPDDQDNRLRFLAGHGISSLSLAVPTLVHSSIVETVLLETIKDTRVADALITPDEGVFLSLTAADCPTLYLYDPVERVIALAHCGWRGITQNIVHNTIKAMTLGFGAHAANLQAYIGPGIRSCHYEVGEDVYNRIKPFHDVFPIFKPARSFLAGGPNAIDLPNIIVAQLVSNGVPLSPRSIQMSFECTYCQSSVVENTVEEIKNPKYFSWRRDHDSKLPSMMAVMGMRKTI